MNSGTAQSSLNWQVALGDAREGLRAVPSTSVDLLLCDPPYPEISRSYGRLTVREWKFLMAAVVRETRRVLKSSGSAVFVIQPNSEYVGRTRAWAFEFIAWIARDWNLIQDVWWWNFAAMPTVHCTRENGLMRASLKACVWAGSPGCYRNQDEVLWDIAESTKLDKRIDRVRLDYTPSGHHKRQSRVLATPKERGGATPYNLIPLANTNSSNSAGAKGHGAGTPYPLAHWWVRYACQPGGLVVDPFCGTATVGEAALVLGRRFYGIDKDPESIRKATERLTSPRS